MGESVADLDDASLAQRIHAAAPQIDVGAEAELCRRFASRARLYGMRHLRNESAAADLAQDVLIMTLQKLRAGEVRDPERLASFILGTCRQMVVDGRRTHRRRAHILNSFPECLTAVEEVTDITPDIDRLAHCLNQLSERERSILVMSFFDDQPAGEVAAAVGVSAGNVRVIRHRAIERMRHCMNARVPT